MKNLISGVRGAICLLWLFLAGVGFSLVLKYQNKAGASAQNTAVWPVGTKIQLSATHPTLLLFGHPQCPCTRATIEELNKLMAQCEGKTSVQVWFYKPHDLPPEWSHSGLWRTVEAIPGVQVREDIDGEQAKLFGAETSGTVFLYGSDQRLLFKGGITNGRGHAGDNEGVRMVVSILSNNPIPQASTPVYGCSLLGCEKPSLP